MTEPDTRIDKQIENRPGSRVETPPHTVVVPNSISMVALLGPGDEHLSLIERGFDADVHVRGNLVTLRGTPAEVALV
jgi:phosphate starvation-inducible protein PhoH and related proteins